MSSRVVHEYISHLRFVDDIVVIAQEKLQPMPNSLASASRWIGLGMNLEKTITIINDHIDARLFDGHLIEIVSEYSYLRQILQLGKNNFLKEATRRIQSPAKDCYRLKISARVPRLQEL